MIRACVTAGVAAFLALGAPACAQTTGGMRASLRVNDQLVINNFVYDPDRLETHLVITDVEGSGPMVNILIFDEAGNLQLQKQCLLPMFGKLNYIPSGILGRSTFTGSIRIIADGGNVAGQYWQFYKNSELSYYDTTLPASDGTGAEALLCQHFVSDRNVDSQIILSNAESDSIAAVVVTFYLDRGKQLSRDRYTIPPNGRISISPFAANEGIQKTGTAVAETLNNCRITGEYWQKSPGDRYQVSLPLEHIPRQKHPW